MHLSIETPSPGKYGALMGVTEGFGSFLCPRGWGICCFLLHQFCLWGGGLVRFWHSWTSEDWGEWLVSTCFLILKGGFKMDDIKVLCWFIFFPIKLRAQEQNCKFKWYHFSCAGITRENVPEGEWLCGACSRVWRLVGAFFDINKSKVAHANTNPVFIILYVICAMQIMSATQPDTFFNVSLNTKIRQLASIFMKPMVGGIVWMRVILRFWESAKANLIVQCLKCFILRNSNLIWTCTRTPYVRNFLFNP